MIRKNRRVRFKINKIITSRYECQTLRIKLKNIYTFRLRRFESINKITEISNARENQEIVNICELLLSPIGKT